MTDERLLIQEAAEVGTAGPIRPDGLIPIYVIRPGVGKGKGKHLYEADMLERNAGVFTNWKMFVDHQAPEAKRAAGGLPRSIRDLGGIVKEAWWDGTVPADPEKGHGEGAVVGLCRPTPLIRQLIETDPALVEASISATATAVRPVQRDGETVYAVEGFRNEGSVDWVSRAGAGGRVAQLAEAIAEAWTDEKEADELFESMPDAELMERLRVSRPDLYEKVAEAAGTTGPRDLRETPNEEGDVEPKEILQEALSTDEGKAAIVALVAPAVEEALQRVVAPKLAELVESALEDERELIVEEAEARAQRRADVRDLREAAHKRIDESKLPETFKRELRSRFDVVEGKPTPDLDVADERDEATGATTKTAAAKLADKVDEAIALKVEQLREIAEPTRVRGQGAAVAATPEGEGDGDEDDPEKGKGKKKVTEAKSTGSEHFDHLLQESGVEVDDDLYAGILPGQGQ